VQNYDAWIIYYVLMLIVIKLCDQMLLALDLETLPELGIPSADEYIGNYSQKMGKKRIDEWDFYVAYSMFRSAAILQGVYKRFTIGTYYCGVVLVELCFC